MDTRVSGPFKSYILRYHSDILLYLFGDLHIFQSECANNVDIAEWISLVGDHCKWGGVKTAIILETSYLDAPRETSLNYLDLVEDRVKNMKRYEIDERHIGTVYISTLIMSRLGLMSSTEDLLAALEHHGTSWMTDFIHLSISTIDLELRLAETGVLTTDPEHSYQAYTQHLELLRPFFHGSEQDWQQQFSHLIPLIKVRGRLLAGVPRNKRQALFGLLREQHGLLSGVVNNHWKLLQLYPSAESANQLRSSIRKMSITVMDIYAMCAFCTELESGGPRVIFSYTGWVHNDQYFHMLSKLYDMEEVDSQLNARQCMEIPHPMQILHLQST